MDLADRIREQKLVPHARAGNGLVTDGWFDLRPYVKHYGLPERMDGMRVLDIGTWDGFWAFEMERRGAEVVALDVEHEWEYDWPPRRRPKEFPDIYRGDGFRLAKEVLGSKVERVHCNIYDATPEKLAARSTSSSCGTVLIHLRDQLLALERLANLCTRPVHLRRRVRQASQPDPVAGVALPRRPRGRPSSSGCPRRRRGSG